MSLKAKIQRDYLLTESNINLPANVADVDEMLRGTKSTARMVVMYNQGVLAAINVEQRAKMGEKESTEVRSLLGIKDELL
jgi:hypothetical protein